MLHSLEEFSDSIYESRESEQQRRNFRQLERLASDPSFRDKQYTRHSISKGNGEERVLRSPSRPLKYVQRRILSLLSDAVAASQLDETGETGETGETCGADGSLEAARVPLLAPCAMAYRPGRGVLDCALPHTGARVLLHLDLKDFFGHLRLPAVFSAIDRALRVSSAVGRHYLNAYDRTSYEASDCYNSVLSFYFAQLCTLNGSLPQGAPTSPLLSNLVFAPSDWEIMALCRDRELAYTRYSDDLFFSGAEIDARSLIKSVGDLLGEKGFVLNREKTAVSGPGFRHRVTGVVVNEKPQASREYRRKIRQEIYCISKFGLEEHLSRLKSTPPVSSSAQIARPDPASYRNQLSGRVAFVLQINPQDREFREYADFLRQL